MTGPTEVLDWWAVRQHLLFNAGRTLGYAVLGAVLGGLGGLAIEAAALTSVAGPLRAMTGILAGVAIGTVGAGYVIAGRSPTGHDLPVLGTLFGRLTTVLGDRVERWVNGPQIIALGSLHGLLPCPILYPVFLYAFVVGSPVHGAVALGTLGLGTIPGLLAYGTVVEAVSIEARIGLHRMLGVAFLLLSYIPLSMGLRLLGVDLPQVPLPFYEPFA